MKTPRVSFLVVFILFFALPTWAGSGGPDADGYRWIDSREPGGPIYSWVEISPRCGGTGTLIAQGDDCNSGLVPILPSRGFRYRGTVFTTLAVCSNGWLSFTDGVDSSCSGRVPDSLPPNNVVAPLWTDLYPVGGSNGSIYYLKDTLGGRNRTIVEWDSVAGFNSGTYYKLEVILDAVSAAVFFQYKYSDNWARSMASIGTEDSTGKVGLAVSQSNIANSYAVKFYTNIPHNVGIARIVRPNTYEPPLSTLVPNAWTRNFGTTTDTFPAYCRIDSAGAQIYLSQRQVTGLRAGDTLLVKFDPWTVGPDSNSYRTTFYTAHPADPDPTNDTLKITVDNHGQRGWLPAQNMGDSINTAYGEWGPAIRGDGNHLIFSSNRLGGYGGWDLWESYKVGGVWQRPTNLGSTLNTSNDDFDPWVSQDGNVLVFSSDRPGGYGTYDLYMSKKVGGNWQTPVNLSNVINSSTWENTGWMSPDTLRLYYAIYQRSGGQGGWDLWMSTKTGGQWQTPADLGTNINGPGEESSPSLSPDEQTLFFVSDYDVFTSRKVSGQWQPKQNLGASVNSGSRENRCCISPDGFKLFFASDRPGGRGSWDLYVSEQGITKVEENNLREEPRSLFIGAPIPNPSDNLVSISLELPSPTKVEAGIYNVAGQRVKTIVNAIRPAGSQKLVWDEKDFKGSKVAPGIYFMKITAGGKKVTRQITILR